MTPSGPSPPPPESIERRAYQRWIAAYDQLDERDVRALSSLLQPSGPWSRISVVMPVFNTPRAFLVEAIDSVRRQIYPHWELCIADDASTDEHVRPVLADAAPVIPESRCSIASRMAIFQRRPTPPWSWQPANGSPCWITTICWPRTPWRWSRWKLRRFPHAELLYTDADNLDPHGERCNPYFKPDWNYDLLLAQNYVNHLTGVSPCAA